MNNADDILETALNQGIGAAAEKYGVSKSHVYNIVDDFRRDTIDGPCTCEKNGHLGCMNCDKNINTRIRL